jgi:hypothetical protein
MFAIYDNHGDAGYALTFKADLADRAALLRDKRFFEPWYWGARGWLALDLVAAEPDWAEVAELVETSYRQVALKRQLRALEA